MKNYYELLSVALDAGGEEIKHAFRREIARYHPDKVCHLGPEFLLIAETRAAELTQAYRVLSDPMARAQYDDRLRAAVVEEPSSDDPSGEEQPAVQPEPGPSGPSPPGTPPPDLGFEEERATRDHFVRRAVLTRFCDAVRTALGSADSEPPRGFDAAFAVPARCGLFGEPEGRGLIVARFVSTVDAAAVDQTWTLAARLPLDAGVPNVFLMGTGLAPRAELSSRIAQLRRKCRANAPLVVPMDVRDWNALVPTEAPRAVRAIIEKLKQTR